MSARDVVPGTPILGEPLPVELMNTAWADRDGAHDAIGDPVSAAAWLRAVSDRLVPGQPDWLAVDYIADRGGLTRAAGELRQLRAALRRLAAEVTADDRPAAAAQIGPHDTAVAVLNSACALAPAWSQLVWLESDEPVRVASSAHAPAELAVSLIAEQAVSLFATSQREQLRACPAPGCQLYFVAAHSREWCSDGRHRIEV
jgi:predicted RNA-binding Zn ribbon-like protein